MSGRTQGEFNPFPGLRPFRSDENHLFFGREDQAAALLELLRKNRFLTVVGTSGSGKSSLVRAGLIPELHGGTMARAGSAWEVVVLRPGGRPIENIARALVDGDLYDPDDPDTLPRLRATLSRSRFGLVEAVKQSEVVGPSTNVLVVVDQFEELFRFRQGGAESEEAAAAFVNLLLTASAQEECQVYVTLTMRSDYLGDCSEIPGLAEAVNRGEYLIPRLQRDQKQDAIVKPIGVGGAKIAPLLVQRLLNDVGDDPDQLPVLQHALMRMWDAWSEGGGTGRPIDFCDLEATGGLADALSRHADEIYEALPDDAHRGACERIFKTLTEKGADNRGIRRPARLERLEAIAGSDHATVSRILDAYRQPGVTFLMPGTGSESELAARTVVDLSHESLMRGWRRLRGWVEEEAQSARIFKRLSDTASLWRDGKAGLFRDPDLQIALSWRSEESPNAPWAEQYGGGFDATMTFLEQSQEEATAQARAAEAARQRELEQARQLAEERDRAARNFRRFSLGMGVVALAALAAFVFAFQKQKLAEAEMVRAEAATILAEHNEKTAEQLRDQAEKTADEVRRRFARSDLSLGGSFIDQEKFGHGIAYLARSLEAEPDNPGLVDRLFNVLAYTAPPGYRSPSLDYGGSRVYAHASTADAALVATGVWGGNAGVRVWGPGAAEPIIELKAEGGQIWHNSLAFSPDPGRRRFFMGRTGPRFGELFDLAGWSRVRVMPQPGINNVQFSVDGKRFLTGSHRDGFAVVWEAETGRVLDKIDTGGGFSIWSPDETQMLVVGTGDSALLVGVSGPPVSIGDGTAYRDIEGREVPVVHAFPVGDRVLHSRGIFSPGGARFLVRRGDGGLALWSVVDNEAPEIVLEGHRMDPAFADDYYFGDQPYTIAAFSPDGQRVLSAGTDMTVRLWDVSKGFAGTDRLLQTKVIGGMPAREVNPVFSRDGRRIMVTTWDWKCYYGAFDEAAPDRLPEFVVPPRPITEGFAFIADPGEIKPLYLPQAGVVSGAIHPRKPIIALGTAEGQVRLFDLVTGAPMGPPFKHVGRVVKVTFSGDGLKLAARSRSGTVRVWDATDPLVPLYSAPATDERADAGVIAREFALGDGVVAAGGRGSRALTTANLILRLAGAPGEKAPILGGGRGYRCEIAAFSRDGTRVATAASGDDSLRVWSAETGDPITAPLRHDEEILSLDFSEGGEFLAAGHLSGRVRLWRVPSGDPTGGLEVRGEGSCTRVVFSPGGRLLAAVFERETQSYAQVWDAATGRPITGKLKSGAVLSDAAFVEGGNRLAAWPRPSTGSGSGVAIVWDVSVSGGGAAPAWLPGVATSFGGNRLNSQSLLETVSARASPPETGSAEPAERRQAWFFRWLGEFPGTRPGSPFRPPATGAYVESLIDQPDLALLDEAVRLRPRNARALARRGVVRPLSGVSDSVRVLSTVDLTRARLLAPDDPEIWWYYGIALEGDQRVSEAADAYEAARERGPMDWDALAAVIEIQERYGTYLGEGPRRELLNEAIAAAGRAGGDAGDLLKRLHINRLELSLAYGNLTAADEDWQAVVEFDALPDGESPRDLLASYLRAAEAEATRLWDAGEADAATRLIRPVAVLAELEKSTSGRGPGAVDPEGYWDPTSALGKAVIWENRQDPQVVLVEAGATWSYLDDGSDQGTGWREPGFVDADWESGSAKLGYGDDEVNTEVGFGPDGDNKYPTTYFRHTFDLADDKKRPFLIVNLVRDDGVIVYLNGVEVLRDNMPSGDVTYKDYAAGNAGAGELEDVRHTFPIKSRSLRTGKNVIAAEVHQMSPTSSDIGFELELLGSNHSPGLYFSQMGRALQASAAALVPQSLRPEWQAVLGWSLGTRETGGGSEVPLETRAQSLRLQVLTGQWEAALETVNGILEETESPVAGLRLLSRKEFILNRLGRTEDLGATRRSFLFPPRPDGLDPRLIDLGDRFNGSLFQLDGSWTNGSGRNLARLPGSFLPINGVTFDLRGIVQLESGVVEDNETYNEKRDGRQAPPRVEGIEIGRTASAVHFLTSCQWGREDSGVEVARFVIHYAGADPGSGVPFPVRYGDDVVDWILGGVDASKIGWRGSNDIGDDIRLSHLVWENPHPGKTIATIDFVSAQAAAAPFLLGITLE